MSEELLQVSAKRSCMRFWAVYTPPAAIAFIRQRWPDTRDVNHEPLHTRVPLRNHLKMVRAATFKTLWSQCGRKVEIAVKVPWGKIERPRHNTWEMSHFSHAKTVYLCVFVLAYQTDCIFNFCFAQEPIIELASVKFTDAKLWVPCWKNRGAPTVRILLQIITASSGNFFFYFGQDVVLILSGSPCARKCSHAATAKTPP